MNNLAELRVKYAYPTVPPCRICGADLTRITNNVAGESWGCDPSGPGGGDVPLEGRTWSDRHFYQSMHYVYYEAGNEVNEDVLGLCNEVEQLRELVNCPSTHGSAGWSHKSVFIIERDAVRCGTCGKEFFFSRDLVPCWVPSVSVEQLSDSDLHSAVSAQ